MTPTISTPRFMMIALAACFASSVQASSGPQEIVNQAIALGAASIFSTMASPSKDAADLNGSYSDPNHPNCLRIISVAPGSNVAELNGTDGNPGCPPDGSGDAWTLEGRVEGDDIFVDFTPKGGPKDLMGVFDGTAIEWPDGNKWTLLSSEQEEQEE